MLNPFKYIYNCPCKICRFEKRLFLSPNMHGILGSDNQTVIKLKANCKAQLHQKDLLFASNYNVICIKSPRNLTQTAVYSASNCNA